MKKTAAVDTTTQLSDISRPRRLAIWINSVMQRGMTFYLTMTRTSLDIKPNQVFYRRQEQTNY